MAEFSVTIKPFDVPKYVILDLPNTKEAGMQPLQKLDLSQLDEQTLNALIEEFALAVMTQAGKA